MSYKILINGKGTILTRDILRHTDPDFVVLSTSTLWEDVRAHLNVFEPDVYVCFYDKSDDSTINQLQLLRDNPKYRTLPIAIVGDSESCELFEKKAPYLAAVKIVRPTSAPEIQRVIKNYLVKNEQLIEEENARSELEAVQKKAEQEAIKAAADAADLRNNIIFSESNEISAIASYAAKSIDESSDVSVLIPETIPDLSPNLIGAVIPSSAMSEKKHILIVDDDRNILKMLKDILGEKYDVTPMLNGKMAEKYLESKTADLVLLDHEMPVETGLEVFKKIKSQAKDIPVIFLTGASDSGTITEILSLKPNGYLLKPINVEKLMEAIESVIG